MEYTTLGRTGLSVSRMGLGGAPLAGDFGAAEAAEVQRMIHEALDAGINFIDTAPKYGNGLSEQRIGQALLQGKRKQVVLATKAARSEQAYDDRTICDSVEQSLQRLQTDWIDLLQLHDVETQAYDQVMNEAVPAMQRLKQEGKIRYLGVTTRELGLLMRYMKTGVFDTIQFYTRYMLVDHTAKDEVLPLAKQMNLGVINGSVLGMGMIAESPAPFLPARITGEAQARLGKLDFLRKPGPKGFIEPGMRFSLGNEDIAVTLTGADSSQVLRMNLGFCDGRGLEPQQLQAVYEAFDGQPLFPFRNTAAPLKNS